MDLKAAYYYELRQRYGDDKDIRDNWTEEQWIEYERQYNELYDWYRANQIGSSRSDIAAIVERISIVHMPADWKPSPPTMAYFEELERKERQADLDPTPF